MLAIQDDSTKDLNADQSTAGVVNDHDSASRNNSSVNQGVDMALAKTENQKEASLDQKTYEEGTSQPRPADWARILEAATQRRTEVLTPENLENMWTKGRNYKRKEKKTLVKGAKNPVAKGSGLNSAATPKNLGKETLVDRPEVSAVNEEELLRLTWGTNSNTQLRDRKNNETQCSQDRNKEVIGEVNFVDESEGNTNEAASGSKRRLKRSSSTSALKLDSDAKRAFTEGGGAIISEFYSPDIDKRREQYSSKSASDMVVAKVGQHVPKLRCRVSTISVKL